MQIDPEFLNIGRWIIGGVGAVVLGAIGYFMKRFIDSVDRLEQSVTSLTIKVAEASGSNEEKEKYCKDKHDEVNRRLNAHSAQLTDHEKRISKGGL